MPDKPRKATSVINALLNQILISPRNPIFAYDLRRVPGGVTALRDFAARWLIIVPVGLGGLWFLMLMPEQSVRFNYIAPWFLIGLFSNFAMLIVSNVIYTFLTITAISEQITSGQWDLLRLTHAAMIDIIEAKFAVAQLRAWKVMILDMTLRIVMAEMVVLAFAVSVFRSGTGYYGTFNFYGIWYLLCVAAFAMAYIYEPMWRMRAITALGMAISARAHNVAFAFLRMFFLIIAVHITQAVVFFGSAWLMVVIAPTLFLAACMAFWGLPAYFAMVSVLVRWIYASIREYALRRAFNTPFAAL